MRQNNLNVFTFTDADGTVRYVGYGGDSAPMSLWKHRKRERSPLNDWLATCDQMPTLTVLGRRLSENAADDLSTAVRARVLAAGADLLTTRPDDSFRTGGGLPKAVVIDGFHFKSMQYAADVLGYSVSKVSRMVKKGVDGARYA